MADKHDSVLTAVFKVTAKTYGRDRICRSGESSSLLCCGTGFCDVAYN